MTSPQILKSVIDNASFAAYVLQNKVFYNLAEEPMLRNNTARPVFRVFVCMVSTLALLSGCNGGGSNSNPPPPSIVVSVSPTTASLNQSGAGSFAATVQNDSKNAGVTWSIGTGSGTLSGSSTTAVTYTAPATIAAAATITLTATSVTDPSQSASAAITLNPPVIPTITSVAVSCAPTSAPIGQTSQCAATVSGTGSYSSAVTWNVAGVQGGNSTVGTISSTGLYTAPAAVPATNPVTITAISIQDNTKSGSAMITVTAAATAIVVNSVSNSSPVPLTQIQLATTGVNPASPVTLTYSDGAGFSATEPAARIQSDGTVIAGVPLYVASGTGEIGPGTVSLVLTQGNLSSAPTTIAIQDLPAVSTYGTQPGQISHSFLVFETMLHARRLNEFQAAQQLVGASVDTTGPQSTMTALIGGSIAARSDVDGVMSNSATVLSWGTLPSGRAVQFDSTQLDVMDRVLGVYLSEQFALPGSSTARKQSQPSPLIARMPDRPALSFTSVTSLLGCLASNEAACFQEAQESVQSSPEPTDVATASLEGLQSTLSLSGAGQEAGLAGLALGYTHLAAAMDSLTHAISTTAECLGSLGCDPSDQQPILDQLNGAGAAIVGSVVETISQVPAILGFQLEEQTTGIIDNAAHSVVTVIQAGSSGETVAADTADVSLVGTSTLPLLTNNLGYETGNAQGSNSQGTVPTLGGLDLCCFGSSQLGIQGLTDPAGNYDLLVPLNVPGTDYAELSLAEYDPTTDAILATEAVDLSGLTSTAFMTLPPLTDTATLPDPGAYAGNCTAQASAVTCCVDGQCETVPAPAPTTAPFNFTLASGTTLSQFTSAQCATADTALAAAGCTSYSCSFSSSTTQSASFSLSCSVAAVTGCTAETVSETCSASLQ